VTARRPLLGHDASFRHLLVEIIVEVVSSGIEGWEVYRDSLTGFDDLFAVKRKALKLDRVGARIGNPECERFQQGP
jgi:hypothetical protein